MPVRKTIFILLLIILLLLPSLLTACTSPELLNLLIAALTCGIKVYIDGNYVGETSSFPGIIGCILSTTIPSGEHILKTLISGQLLQSLSSSTVSIPDQSTTYQGSFIHGGKFRLNVSVPSSVTANLPGVRSSNGQEIPIVAMTSRDQIDPNSAWKKIHLYPEWNLFGSATYALSSADLKIWYNNQLSSLVDAHSKGWIRKELHFYDNTLRNYRYISPPEGQVEPNRGYWVWSYVEGYLILPSL